MKKILRPGMKIELRPDDMPNSEEEEDSFQLYSSQISDVREDGEIEAYMPIEQGRLILISVGSQMDMYCYTDRGIYECRVGVKERYTNEGLYLLLLHVTSDLRKHQRREFYRYECSLPMQDRWMDDSEQKLMTDNGWLCVDEDLPMSKSTVIDISGGGIQFTGKHSYGVNELVYCKFDFGKEYRLCVEIMGCDPIAGQPGNYCHRARFVGMSKQEREGIIRYIFTLERLEIKKNRAEKEGEYEKNSGS